MRLAPSAPVIEEHHLKGVLSGIEFPMVAHRPAWCVRTRRVSTSSRCRTSPRDAGYLSAGTAAPGDLGAGVTSNANRNAGILFPG